MKNHIMKITAFLLIALLLLSGCGKTEHTTQTTNPNHQASSSESKRETERNPQHRKGLICRIRLAWKVSA